MGVQQQKVKTWLEDYRYLRELRARIEDASECDGIVEELVEEMELSERLTREAAEFMSGALSRFERSKEAVYN